LRLLAPVLSFLLAFLYKSCYEIYKSDTEKRKRGQVFNLEVEKDKLDRRLEDEVKVLILKSA